MAWFQLIFPLVMLLFPLVFVLASGVSTEALPTAKPLMRGLWACTLGTLAIHLALWFAGIGAATYMGFAFMPLWFFLAMPALVHRRPEWQRLHGSTPQRSASLRSRSNEPVLSRWMVQLPAWITVAGLVSIAAAFVTRQSRGGVSDPVDTGTFVTAAALVIGCGVSLVGMLPAILRTTAVLPEPEPEGGDAALREEYAKHRRFVAASMTLLFGGGMNLVVVCVASCMMWIPAADPLRMTLIIACSAGGGSVIGLMGALIGTMSSVRRAKIAAHLRALERV